MKIAITFIGTSKYANFFDGFKKAVDQYFLNECDKTFFVFTDQPENQLFNKDDVVVTKIQHREWPWVTLHRFKNMCTIVDQLAEFDYVFFIDADLWPCSDITFEEILGHGRPLVGVQHPGFIGKIGTFETDSRSTANIFDGNYNVKVYRQGCFWGGKSNNIIEMIKTVNSRIDKDTDNDIMAVWHDESHMNKYFLENNDKVFTLHPGFATPQEGYEEVKKNYPSKMVHLHKDLSEFPRFEGIGR